MDLYGFCHLTCIPVRAEASERSEMVNQILFGETFEIVDAVKGWKVIRGTLDKYEGFIDEKQFLQLSGEQFLFLKNRPDQFPEKFISYVKDDTGRSTLVMPASSLGGFEHGRLQIGGRTFYYDDPLVAEPEKARGEKIAETAGAFLNVPYLWGGRSVTGIDCSGLVQNVFKVNGVRLNRDASYQAREGETLNLIYEAEPGDLVFFDNDEGEIIHVGIIAGDNKIIHASGWVRMDEIDHQGIFNKQINKYTHKLRLIKRVI